VNYSGSASNLSFGYDRAGRRTAITNGTDVCNLLLHPSGLLVSESWSGGTLNGFALTNIYDSLLRRTTNGVVNSTGAWITMSTNSYDAASRLSTVSDGSNSAAYAYLQNSPLLETITFKQGSTTRLTTLKQYDYLNRLTQISNGPSADTSITFNYAYNSANQRTAVTNSDNSRWSYGYDSLGQVTSGKKYWSDGIPVAGQQFEYGFDDIGNRTYAASGGDEWATNLRYQNYTVNNLNEYTSRSVPGSVDVIGTAKSNSTVTVNLSPTYRKSDYFRANYSINNATGAVWQGLTNVGVLANGSNADIVTTNSGNVFLPKTPEAFLYDADGNVTNDGRWFFTWDAMNRLIAMEPAPGVPDGAKRKLLFAYDYMGRRISKTVSNYTAGAWTFGYGSHFLYDGWNLISELNETNGSVAAYMWGNPSGPNQATRSARPTLTRWYPTPATAPTNLFYVLDGNGNVAALVSSVEGSIAAVYDYGPFGETLRASGVGSRTNILSFSKKYADAESMFLYYGFRFLNPSAGRWLNRDPLGEEGGAPVYAFVSNDPVNRRDLLGLSDQNRPPIVVFPPNSGQSPLYGPPAPEPRMSADGRGLPSFVSEEQHFFVGSGFTRVSCCDENYSKRIFWYRKICFGGAIGFGAGGGAVISGLSGKNCRGKNYEGWFYEFGGSFGPLSGGADIGYNDDGDLSGVNELAGGVGASPPGVMIKSTWCYYTLFSEKTVPCGCRR